MDIRLCVYYIIVSVYGYVCTVLVYYHTEHTVHINSYILILYVRFHHIKHCFNNTLFHSFDLGVV